MKECGVQELKPGDKGILFSDIKTDKDMVMYLELVQKIFPMFNDTTGSVVDNVGGLVEQIKQEMRLRGVRSTQIFKEMKNDFSLKDILSPADENKIDITKLPSISREEFRKAIKKKGFAMSQKTVDKVFYELDSDNQNSLSYSNFRHALLMDSEESTPDYTLNKINLELKSCNATVEQLFEIEEEEMEELGEKKPTKASRRRKTADDGMDFQEFTDAIKKLKLDLDIVDLETLFLVVDSDNSGLLSKKEVLKSFKKFETEKKLNLNSFRKAIYQHLTANGKSLDEFYDEFDVRQYGKLTSGNFKDMIKALKFDKPNEDEVKELFTSINLKKNYRLSF
jgi:Ca2+-binding EF-hand superfamily protein